jgi:hypothetical protein
MGILHQGTFPLAEPMMTAVAVKPANGFVFAVVLTHGQIADSKTIEHGTIGIGTGEQVQRSFVLNSQLRGHNYLLTFRHQDDLRVTLPSQTRFQLTFMPISSGITDFRLLFVQT